VAISDPASSPVIGASRTPVPRGSRWADSRGLAAQIIRFGGASLRFTAGCAAAPTSVTSRQATCSPLPRVPEGPRTASRRCQRVTVPGGATAAGGYGIPASRGRRAERRLGMSFGNLDNGARPRRPRATGRGTALAWCWWRSRRSGGTASPRRRPSTAAAGWRRWHDFPGEGEPGRDNDQLPVRGAHCERGSVGFLKDAQHIGDGLAVTWCGPAPADHDPLADIGGCEPDL